MAGGGPKSPTPWGRRARRGCRGVVWCRGAAVRGGAGAQQCGAARGRGAGLRRGAAWGCVGAVGARRARWRGGGGVCGLVGGCAREGDGGAVSTAGERHRAADRAEDPRLHQDSPPWMMLGGIRPCRAGCGPHR